MVCNKYDDYSHMWLYLYLETALFGVFLNVLDCWFEIVCNKYDDYNHMWLCYVL